MRRIQTMVRLTDKQRDALDAIAYEIDRDDAAEFARRSLEGEPFLASRPESPLDGEGMPNKSATIRRILADFDVRLR